MLTAAEDRIATPPTLVGESGRAWEMAPPEGLGPHATVATWIIEAPWAHPVWHSYALSLVHLRPAEGIDQAKTRVYLPGATHELVLMALNPEFPREPILQGNPAQFLLPVNFAAQIIEPSDAGAMARAEVAVQRILAGTLSPDTDYISVWAAIFGDNMLKKGLK